MVIYWKAWPDFSWCEAIFDTWMCAHYSRVLTVRGRLKSNGKAEGQQAETWPVAISEASRDGLQAIVCGQKHALYVLASSPLAQSA